MRVVGYVREASDPSDGANAFSQQEQLRRHAADHGHRLVALCQDLREPGRAPSRDGYLSLLGVVASGGVDAVVIPAITIFSSDAIVQEIMLWDLRGRGVKVLSTNQDDMALLDATVAPEPSRMVIRDVLERVDEHTTSIGGYRIDPPGIWPDGDVLVQIVEADIAEHERAAGPADTTA